MDAHPTQTLRRHNILIVDDDPIILKMMQRLLSYLPHNLILTDSPQEALELLKSREVSLLLCDMAMPKMDGNVVLQTARQAQPNTVSILVSGKADRDATIKAINEGGIWKFLLKPWDPQEMVKVVEEGLGRYETLCWQRQKLEDLAKNMSAITQRRTEVAPKKRVAAPKPAVKQEPPPSSRVRLQVRRPARVVHLHKEVGAFFGKRYKILELIDEGGMGTIYKATDTLLGITVALKVLSPSYTRKEENVQALKEEARIAMQLSHRHIVRLHNLQISGGTFFLVMEFVEGCTFRQVLAESGRLPQNIVIQVAEIVGDALDYAHRHNVLHRDLKPENLMLAQDGVLKIIDFGLACLMGAEHDPELIAGTPIYMSPEQIRGNPLDQRTDVYSMGAILYELLSGIPAFPPDAEAEEVLQLGAPELPDVPPGVRRVLAKAMAFDREERWPSAGNLAKALSHACTDTTPVPTGQ